LPLLLLLSVLPSLLLLLSVLPSLLLLLAVLRCLLLLLAALLSLLWLLAVLPPLLLLAAAGVVLRWRCGLGEHDRGLRGVIRLGQCHIVGSMGRGEAGKA